MEKSKRRRKRKSDPAASPKPASGHLRIVQDFLNTQDVDAQTDALSSPEEVRAWLVDQGLLTAEVKLTKSDRARARNQKTGGTFSQGGNTLTATSRWSRGSRAR